MGERGLVLPLLAICLVPVLGFAGISVDVGFLEYRQQAQQSATDAAALGGAQQLVRAGCGSTAAAEAAAYADSASNGFPNGGNVTVTPQNPPQTGPYSGNNCAVSVGITTMQVGTFFSRLFGYPMGMSESTGAVALVTASNTGCIYLLSTTQQSDFSNSKVDAPQCGIIINDSANMSNSWIDAASIGYAGPGPNISKATFPEATPAPILAVADPCPEIPGCAYLANNPPSTSGCSAGVTFNNVTLSASCYNSLTLTGTDTLSSGLYVINDQFHLNNATVSGSGVTIYMTANVSDTNFSNAHLTLSPPTSGNTTGVLFYRVPTQSSALDLSTCTCNFSGLLYFPTTQVNYSKLGGNYTVLFFGSANFSASNTTDFGTPPAGQTLITRAALAE
jgi:Putative Flp pilus-assembly TadE/G-like